MSHVKAYSVTGRKVKIECQLKSDWRRLVLAIKRITLDRKAKDNNFLIYYGKRMFFDEKINIKEDKRIINYLKIAGEPENIMDDSLNSIISTTRKFIAINQSNDTIRTCYEQASGPTNPKFRRNHDYQAKFEQIKRMGFNEAYIGIALMEAGYNIERAALILTDRKVIPINTKMVIRSRFDSNVPPPSHPFNLQNFVGRNIPRNPLPNREEAIRLERAWRLRQATEALQGRVDQVIRPYLNVLHRMPDRYSDSDDDEFDNPHIMNHLNAPHRMRDRYSDSDDDIDYDIIDPDF